MAHAPAHAPWLPQTEDLVNLARERGLDAAGIATAEPFAETRQILEERKAQGLHGGMAFTYRKPQRSADPQQAMPGAKALFVGARSYYAPTPDHPTPRVHGRVARYVWDDHYTALREALGAVALVLKDAGWKARVLVDDNALVDREAARRAGLGWYGKNANLLLPGAGSWFVLGSVLTDAPLPATSPDDLPPDGCGTCTRCIQGCPTNAIIAPGVVDARRCLAWLVQASGPFPTEYREALGDRIYGCDDCQEVCPPNRRVSVRNAASLPEGPPQNTWVDILEMLELSDDELLETYGRWYIPRREPRYLRRNALVVLGNTADGVDPEVVAALQRCLRSEDAMVRGHAIWAARRLGRDDLVSELPALAADPDPEVQKELRIPVNRRR